jgi:hypothetical protein
LAIVTLACITTIAAVAACAANPIKTAQGSSQEAFAVYGEFVIYEELGAALMSEPSVPDSVKQRIKEADAKAKPIVDSLRKAAAEYAAAQTLLASGPDANAKLDVASQNLATWYTQARDAVIALIAATRSK